MSEPLHTCGRCGEEFTFLAPVTFDVRGVAFHDHTFCSHHCALLWAGDELNRMKGWLRRIVARSRGFAGRMAKRALRGRPADEFVEE